MASSSELKPILITGGCGFIASNLILRLLKTGRYLVVNIDRLNYCSNVKNVENDFDYQTKQELQVDLTNYVFYQCDINNTEFVRFILRHHNIKIIYHFAAQSHVDQSFGNSSQFVTDNVLGTANLLECARDYIKSGHTLERFIHVSTDEVYGQIDQDNEELVKKYGLFDPTNPYAASKASAEIMAKSYLRSYNLPLIITRSNNVYGPRQFWEKIIPKFIRYIQHDKPCPVYGGGQALRKYLYVEDACAAYELIMEKGQIGQVYEIGSNNEYNALQIAGFLLERIKPDMIASGVDHVEDRPFHDMRYIVNDQKLTELGWKEETPFEVGLTKTISWYVDYSIPTEYWAYDEKVLLGRHN